jgi:hypothetical protein
MKKILIAVGAVLLVASNAFAETSREYLETIDIKDLCIAFPKNHQGFWVAKVKDPEGYYHTVTVGSYIGKDFGRIMKITNDTVEVVEIILDEFTGEYVERPLTLQVPCPDLPRVFQSSGKPPCANSPSDGSHIVWLMYKGKESIHLGLSVGDRSAWRWVYAESREIQPATSEEAKELKEEYGDADLSRFAEMLTSTRCEK